MKYLILSLLWVAYCALHSYLISISFTNFISRMLKKYYAFYRLFYVLFSLVLLIVLINYSSQFDKEIIITYVTPWSEIRYILTYGSLLLFFWAFFFNYDSLSFFGIRQIMNLGVVKKTDSSNEIKRKGLLGIVRHPMYLCLIIYLWCQTFKMIDIILNIVLTVYIIIGTYLEENKLVHEFGDSYVNYQKEVPMLIPFIKTK